MYTIVYIHGANASSVSFNYIRQHIHSPNSILVDYNSSNGFINNLDDMKYELSNHDKLFFVAHSLGGIYATHLADHFSNKTIGGTTISTPYGGCIEADVIKLFAPFSRLMTDIGPNSYPMRTARQIEYPCRWTNIVTTNGKSPFVSDANDGVVTVNSMKRHRDAMEIREVNLNHFEVLLSPFTVAIIQQAIDNSIKK